MVAQSESSGQFSRGQDFNTPKSSSDHLLLNKAAGELLALLNVCIQITHLHWHWVMNKIEVNIAQLQFFQESFQARLDQLLMYIYVNYICMFIYIH
jgi:hypothetical protein